MTDNRTEEQQILDDFETNYETNRAIMKAFDAGELIYDDSLPVPELPPEATDEEMDNVMIVRTFRMPTRLDTKVRTIAKKRGLDVSALLREWIAEMVAADAADVPVSLADIMRAVASVQPLPDSSWAKVMKSVADA